MKPSEARDLHTEELHARLAEFKEELFNLRFQLATGQLDNHRRIRQVTQEIARVRTVLRERDFAAVGATVPGDATEHGGVPDAAGGSGGAGDEAAVSAPDQTGQTQADPPAATEENES